jgi:hypothetical protein
MSTYKRERNRMNPLQQLQKSRALHRLSRSNPSLVNPIMFSYTFRRQRQRQELDDISNEDAAVSQIDPMALFADSKKIAELIPIVESKESKVPDSNLLTSYTQIMSIQPVNEKDSLFKNPVKPQRKTASVPTKPSCGATAGNRRRPFEAPKKKKKERFHASEVHRQIWEKHVAHKAEQKRLGFKTTCSAGCG